MSSAASVRWAFACSAIFCVIACSSSSGAPSNGTTTTTTSGDGGTTVTSGSCDTDPLHTGLTAQQTGVSVDAFDCSILEWTAKYKEPDPMIFKAIIYVESRFDDTSVACTNDPCGTPAGWTTAESGCYGLMQVVPACGDDPDDAGLMSNGQPNLTTDATSGDWAGSIFNPEVNIEIGISGVAGNRAQEMKKFPGCTTEQYTLMAVGDYNSYGSTKSCTEYNTDYDNPMLDAYKQYATAAGYAAHNY
jgi:Transglycosylase SLT domain